jgi:hypothetical protein
MRSTIRETRFRCSSRSRLGRKLNHKAAPKDYRAAYYGFGEVRVAALALLIFTALSGSRSCGVVITKLGVNRMTTSICCYKPPHPLSLSLIEFRRRLLTAGGAFRRGGKPNPELTSSDDFETSPPSETPRDLADLQSRYGEASRFAGKGQGNCTGRCRMRRCEVVQPDGWRATSQGGGRMDATPLAGGAMTPLQKLGPLPVMRNGSPP